MLVEITGFLRDGLPGWRDGLPLDLLVLGGFSIGLLLGLVSLWTSAGAAGPFSWKRTLFGTFPWSGSAFFLLEIGSLGWLGGGSEASELLCFVCIFCNFLLLGFCRVLASTWLLVGWWRLVSVTGDGVNNSAGGVGEASVVSIVGHDSSSHTVSVVGAALLFSFSATFEILLLGWCRFSKFDGLLGGCWVLELVARDWFLNRSRNSAIAICRGEVVKSAMAVSREEIVASFLNVAVRKTSWMFLALPILFVLLLFFYWFSYDFSLKRKNISFQTRARDIRQFLSAVWLFYLIVFFAIVRLKIAFLKVTPCNSGHHIWLQ